MYIKAYKVVSSSIHSLEIYRKIANLVFEPAVDLVGASVPINEFSVDIKTTDTIAYGEYAELYDNANTLWAKYHTIYAERIDVDTVRIRAQSDIAVLDRITLPAVYYSAEAVSNVLDNIFKRNRAGSSSALFDYTLDPSFASETITGFCPEQSARDRLTWVCFAIGGYVKAFFNAAIEILPIDSTETAIPMNKTYYKPSVTYHDYVTAVLAKTYSFTAGTPTSTDEYVTDANGTHYIISEGELSLANPDAPSSAPDNVVRIEKIYLINSNNVSALLSRLAAWYFKRTEIDLDALDDGSYLPGDKVAVCVDEETMCSGYIDSAAFAFGHKAKAAIHLTAAEDKETGNLTIIYVNGATELARAKYLFPVGYEYSVENPYVDLRRGTHRYIYRPENVAATGTIVAGANTDTEECEVALDLDLDTLTMHTLSVDSFEVEELIQHETSYAVGVIG